MKLVSKESLPDVLTKVHSLVYAQSQDKFEAVWQDIKNQPHADFIRYMENNWLRCTETWALYEHRDAATLGNTTNNQIESHFHKIKNVIISKRKFSECVRTLVEVCSSSSVQQLHAEHIQLHKQHYTNGYQGPGVEYFKYCTSYAAKKVIEQLNGLAGGEKYKANIGNGSISGTNSKSGSTFTVDTSSMSCSCGFTTSMLLPCRHVFAARQKLSFPVFAVELIGTQWLLSSLASCSHPQPTARVYLASTHIFDNATRRCLSRKEKFSKASALLEQISIAMSKTGQAQFNVMYNFMNRVKEKFESGYC